MRQHHTTGLGHAFAPEIRFLHAHRRLVKRMWMDVRNVAVAAMATTLAMVTVQLLYPARYSRPFAQLQGISVGLQTTTGIANHIGSLEKQAYNIAAHKKSYKPTYAQVGLLVDEQATARQMLRYDWRERLVPFSLFRRDTPPIAMQYDSAALKSWAARIAADNTVQPTNASIQKSPEGYAVTPAITGIGYSEKQIIAGLKQGMPGQAGAVVLTGAPTQPPLTTKAFQTAIQHLQQQTAKPFVITADGASLTLSPAQLAHMADIVADPITGTVTVRYNHDLLRGHLTALANQIYVSPSQVVVTLRDGVEIGRTAGQAGKALALAEAVSQVATALESRSESATLKSQPVAVNTHLVRTYSSTSAGLQALLDNWLVAHRGPRWGIVVRELAGARRTASAHPGDRFVTASVYKPFVAMVAQGKLESGELSPDTPTGAGKSLDDCIELMIVQSDNSCAHAVGDLVGWSTATGLIQAKGFTNTSVTTMYDFYTTANDTTAFLESLAEGSLLGSAQNARLIGMMRRQIYRNGIPSGSRGSPVANKVGYVDSYRHDIGIVFHPKGTYMLSILSYGGNYPQIVDLSRTIYDYMSQ